jgi:protein SCO1/2
MSKPVIAALAVVFLAAGVLTIVTAAVVFNREGPKEKEPVAEQADERWRDVKWIKEFKLTERSGKTFDSRSMKGEVWVASFFFAACPTECKLQNNHLASIARDYGPKGVTFVSITCDPKNDTPARLREYANRFNADDNQWLFLTGDLLHIKRIGAERFSLAVVDSDEGPTHSSRLVVVDRNGEIRGRYDWHDASELTAMKLMLNECLAEEPTEGGKEST